MTAPETPTKPNDPPSEGGEDEDPAVERDRWIEEAAYYRAEKRGFTPGYALEDWLAAEALVDFELSRRTGS